MATAKRSAAKGQTKAATPSKKAAPKPKASKARPRAAQKAPSKSGKRVSGAAAKAAELFGIDPKEAATATEKLRSQTRHAGARLKAEVEKLGHRGLRHTAALGLTERTDAFVLVISEERGTISVARRGELTELSVQSLREAVEAFLREIAPRPPHRRLLGSLRQNLLEKVVAVALSTALWWIFVGRHAGR